MPLDQRSVLVETPVTRWLSALCRMGEGRRKWTGGGGAENGDFVNWAFMRPLCGLSALAVVDGTAAGDAFRAAVAVFLLQGRERGEALARACAAGAIAASRPGAQPSEILVR